jgi:PAS domain S-box-containing protein
VKQLRHQIAELEERLSMHPAPPTATDEKPSSASELVDARRLSVTLDSIADAVITTNARGLIERLNPVAERLTGFSQGEAKGKPLAEAFRVGTNYRTADGAVAIATTGAHSSATLDPITLWDKHGTPHSIELSASTIRDSEDAVFGTVLVFRDVTERREHEARKLQSDKLQALGQLVGGLAHELNNLFTGTMSFAELLRLKVESAKDKESAQFAESIVENTRRASELVGRLLAFARERPRESAPVDVHHLLEEIADRPEPAGNVTLAMRLDAADAFVRGDAQALRDSLVSLVTNAREAMPTGGVIRVLTETAELSTEFAERAMLPIRPGRYLRVDVIDEGVGIPSAVLAHIFEPFFTTKRGGSISGLGLSVVYATVRDHGGTIEVASEPSRGTRIRLYLPQQSEIPITSLRPSNQLVEGRGRLLLADDEPTLRRAEAALLRRLGYEVSLAEDGEQALEVYRTDPLGFDLVLLDIMMPKLNGRETLRELRRINPRVKALYISAFGLSSEDPSAEDGVQGVIRKPFTAATLSQRISEVLESSRIDDLEGSGDARPGWGTVE